MRRNRMKNLLRRLHIVGGGSDDAVTVPIGQHPNPNLTPLSDHDMDNDSGFNVAAAAAEEEFQMQLALAMSASHTHDDDNNNNQNNASDSDSAQIDAAKQMSLGYQASLSDAKALLHFQSLRYWNYSLIGYEEKVMDGFYDVYGITSNSTKRGKMPLLVDLQAKPISQNGDCEVVLVNRLVDLELQQLEKKACILFNECCVSEKGLILSGLLQRLADIVVTRMGGTVGSADRMTERWARRSHELQDSSRTIVLPLGHLDVGLSRHRALLFKVLADRINIPCMLVKGICYTGSDDGALNLIRADDGSEYIIDMMGAPGALIPAEIPSSQLQNYSFAARSCEEVVGLPNRAHVMLDSGTGELEMSSALDRIPMAVKFQSEDLLNVGNQTKSIESILVGMNETEVFGHNLGNLLQSLHKSCESSSHTEESRAEKIRVKNVSKYVLSAAKNPEFAQRLHTVLSESGAFPPHDLFSDVNPQYMGEDIIFEQIVNNIVPADTDKREHSACDTRLQQQEEYHTDAIRVYNSIQCDYDNARKGSATACDRVDELEQSGAIIADSDSVNSHKVCREQYLSSLSKMEVSCQTRNGFDFSCDEDDENSLNNVGAASNNIEVGKVSATQINEAPCVECRLPDNKSEKANLVLGERKEWEIQWNDLRIGRRIGIGSYGEVFHADHNGTEVAVKKFLDQDFSGDAVAQFKSEVEIMLRLRHPNIVLFMGAITRPPHLSILTEFLPRGNLYELLHRPNFQLDDKRRLRMALDVAKGMNYLHTSNPPIVHRDLKSLNILVDKHWVLKVCDFGLSRMKHHTFLSSGSFAGTPEWMAPEVLRNEPANEKCDVYSFGVILWELTTKMIPWQGLNSMQVVGAVGFQNRHLEISEDVDPELAQIIQDCWQMEPHLRPSFSQLLSRLCRLLRLLVKKTSSAQQMKGK